MGFLDIREVGNELGSGVLGGILGSGGYLEFWGISWVLGDILILVGWTVQLAFHASCVSKCHMGDGWPSSDFSLGGCPLFSAISIHLLGSRYAWCCWLLPHVSVNATWETGCHPQTLVLAGASLSLLYTLVSRHTKLMSYKVSHISVNHSPLFTAS